MIDNVVIDGLMTWLFWSITVMDDQDEEEHVDDNEEE